MSNLTLGDFVARWRNTQLRERAGAQSHFIDLCTALQHAPPAAMDQTGETYTFDRGLTKAGGGKGFADVWFRHHFAWEYKGAHKDLDAAYKQLLQYHDELENPPLLVVSDMNRFEVHTKFTNTPTRVYRFCLDDLERNAPTSACALRPVEVLRALFIEPRRLRYEHTPEQVTERAAQRFAQISESMELRGVPPAKAAHFLMRILFCLFAESIGILPKGLFTELLSSTQTRPAEFSKRLKVLFRAMSGRNGSFGVHDIHYFNGGLFTNDEVVDLSIQDLAVLRAATSLDWSSIEPAIFGTLFECSLQAAKRTRLGVHYTGLDDINAVIEPVLMQPLRTRWVEIKRDAWKLVDQNRSNRATRKNVLKKLDAILRGFADEIASVRVLDPACGSGNFLYVALKSLLDLEKQISFFASSCGITGYLPRTTPQTLYGLESDPFAHELASIVVWIGYLQWQSENGVFMNSDPVLRPLENIRHVDALLDAAGNETHWPDADVIVGNPPFLGGKRLRRSLGDGYVEALFNTYRGRVSRESDLVVYWFEKARASLETGRCKRAGLLATQAIRGGANRVVLERIKETGDIFWAESDRDWVLDGANVHVSMIGFDDGTEATRILNGDVVAVINANLTSNTDTTLAHRLRENDGLCFMGTTKVGCFDVPSQLAKSMLLAPLNPNGRPNSDVVRPWVNGMDITRRPRGMWIIDFGATVPEREAALYEIPFEYVRRHVRPVRITNSRESYRTKWWLHGEPRPELRRKLNGLKRYIATPALAKHRLFVWCPREVTPDHALFVFPRDDDYFFGVLHSRIHEVWGLHMGTALEDRPRYTPTSTFETFPFPWPPGKEPKNDSSVKGISEAVKDLVEKRDAWLNPHGTSELERRHRTLTNLYNKRPAWLAEAHRKLDEAVASAYGWPVALGDMEIIENLAILNQRRVLVNEKKMPSPLKKTAASSVG